MEGKTYEHNQDLKKLRRKERHQRTEKLRRQRINNALATLAELVGLEPAQERAVILEAVVDAMTTMKHKLGDQVTSKPVAKKSKGISSRDISVQTDSEASVSCAMTKVSTLSSPSSTSSESVVESEQIKEASPRKKAIDELLDFINDQSTSSAMTCELEDFSGQGSIPAISHSNQQQQRQEQHDVTSAASFDLESLVLEPYKNDHAHVDSVGPSPLSMNCYLPQLDSGIGYCMFVGVRCVKADAAIARMCGVSDPQALVGCVNLNFRVREDMVFSGIDLLEFYFGSKTKMITIERMRRIDGTVVWVEAEQIKSSVGVDSLPVIHCKIRVIPPPMTGALAFVS